MTMPVGVVAGFGQPIGDARMQALVYHGFTLIRQDLQTCGGRTPNVGAVFEECSEWAHRVRPLYICTPDTLPLVPDGSWVELYNEPEAMAPVHYATACAAAWPIVQAKDLTLWAGSISNLDLDSLAWLDAVLLLVPTIEAVAVHRYTPGKDQDTRKAHKGFASRDSEVLRLKQIIGARPFIVSEVGYHMARFYRWGFWPARLTAYQQAARLQQEIAFWQEHGAAACVIYQENDAPGNTPDKYGLRDEHGTWKTSTVYGQARG